MTRDALSGTRVMVFEDILVVGVVLVMVVVVVVCVERVLGTCIIL